MITLSGLLIGSVWMLVLMAVGLHVGTLMLGLGLVAIVAFYGFTPLQGFGNQLWSIMNDYLLTSIPLFVLLGEILMRSGTTKRMYTALSYLFGRLPGGLVHTNIAASALFASVSGSSVATAATIATVAVPEFRNRHYDEKLVLGSIAAGGTLGIMFPPSINLIIYGAMTNTSIGELFAAAIVPGLLLTAIFMLGIVAISYYRNDRVRHLESGVSFRVKLAAQIHLLPPLSVFAITMGSIVYGWATPTEAAGVGVIFALIIAAIYRALNITMLQAAFLSTIRTASLCLYVLVGAFYLNFVVGLLGVPSLATSFLEGLQVSQFELILLLLVFYFVLGTALDSMAMIVGTLPIVFPLVIAAGIDPVWFGIFLVLMAELALISPPVGMNIYVIQAVRGRGSIWDVFVGVTPFAVLMLGFVVLLIAFPSIVTFTRGAIQ